MRTGISTQSKRRAAILLFFLLHSFFFIQCVQKGEVAPFFDGLYLEYDVVKTYKSRDEISLKMDGTEVRVKVRYHVESADNKYRIMKIDTDSQSGDILNEKEYIVDMYGKDEGRNNYLQIWLPVTRLVQGDTLYGNFKVIRKEKWKEWDVLVLMDESAPVAEWYYDQNTGLMVGKKLKFGVRVFGSEQREWTLADTNSVLM
jgi:hypothetical protein